MLVNEIAKLEINNAGKNGILKIFISKEEKKLGKIMVLAHLAGKADDGEQIIKRIIAETKYSYFESPTDDPEAALENTLQKVNFLISHIVKEEGKTWLKHFGMLIAANQDGAVHLSKVGDLRAFLVQNQKITDIAGSNVFEDEINPIKPFSNILSGEIAKDSIMLLTSESVLDYISQEKLRKISSESKPNEAIEKIGELLAKTSQNTMFSIVIIKRYQRVIDEKTKRMEQIRESEESAKKQRGKEIEKKAAEEREEEKEIQPAQPLKTEEKIVSPELATRMEALTVEQKESIRSEQEAAQKDIPQRKKTHAQATEIIKKFLAFLRALSDKTEQAMTLRRNHVRTLANALKTPLERKKAMKMNQHKTHSAVSSFLPISKNKGIVLKIGIPSIIMVVIGVFLFQNIQTQKRIQMEQKKQTEYFANISEIKDKINEAMGMLVYNEKAKAKGILLELMPIIEALPSSTEEEALAKTELAKQNEEYLQLALGMKILRAISPMFDWQTLDASLSPSAIFLDGRNLYTFNSSNNAIYSFNLDSKKGEKLSIASSGVSSLRSFVGKSDAEIIFYDETGNLAALDLKAQKIIRKEADSPLKDSVLSAYANKIYSLNPANNKLYKHNKTLTGFSKGEEWLKDGIDAGDAVSMSIDSNIWILKKSGEIIKLFKGKREKFALAIDPRVESPIKINVEANETLGYILDRGTSRFVAVNKNSGATEKQYSFPELTNLLDFAVSGKNLYLLNESLVYEIKLDDSF